MKKQSIGEAQLEVGKTIKKTILALYTEEDGPITEDDELDAEDFATILVNSLGLTVTSVNEDGTFSAKLSIISDFKSLTEEVNQD